MKEVVAVACFINVVNGDLKDKAVAIENEDDKDNINSSIKNQNKNKVHDSVGICRIKTKFYNRK